MGVQQCRIVILTAHHAQNSLLLFEGDYVEFQVGVKENIELISLQYTRHFSRSLDFAYAERTQSQDFLKNGEYMVLEYSWSTFDLDVHERAFACGSSFSPFAPPQ